MHNILNYSTLLLIVPVTLHIADVPLCHERSIGSYQYCARLTFVNSVSPRRKRQGLNRSPHQHTSVKPAETVIFRRVARSGDWESNRVR